MALKKMLKKTKVKKVVKKKPVSKASKLGQGLGKAFKRAAVRKQDMSRSLTENLYDV